jgi:hypothetical protein
MESVIKVKSIRRRVYGSWESFQVKKVMNSPWVVKGVKIHLKYLRCFHANEFWIRKKKYWRK